MIPIVILNWSVGMACSIEIKCSASIRWIGFMVSLALTTMTVIVHLSAMRSPWEGRGISAVYRKIALVI
jgi:hypothetical protein